ncbi:MAG TPA: hypothetical protein PLL00_14420 [Bacteroidia bacterium]|nr:hypothetical protein [Bacteroidia bacterium]
MDNKTEFNHDSSWSTFEHVLSLKLPIKDSWNKIIDFHEQLVPNKSWKLLRELDVEGEQEQIVMWFENLVLNANLPDAIISLWVGIIELTDDEEDRYAIHLTGSEKYEENDNEWASDATFLPEDRYASPPLLNAMSRIIKEHHPKEDFYFLDWILPMAYCALTIDEITRIKINKALFLKFQTKINVSAGWDNGDFKDVSAIEKN